MPFSEAQLTLWVLLDDPSSSRPAKFLSVFVMLVIGLSVASFTLESVPADCRVIDEYMDPSPVVIVNGVNTTYDARSYSAKEVCPEPEDQRSPYYEIEFFCIMVFTLEFVLRIFACPAGPGICRFLVQPMNIIDLLAILPFYIDLSAPGGGGGLKGLAVLRVLRLTRVLRIFKMSRNFQGLILLLQTFKKSAAALIMLVFFVAMSLIVFATLIYYFEMGEWDEYREQYVRWDGSATPFESIPTSMWWCIVTMTTVGYGDTYPITLPGQLVAIVTMFCGLIVLSLPITIIGANFDDLYRDMRKKDEERKHRVKKEREQEQAEAMATNSAKRGINSIGEKFKNRMTHAKEGAASPTSTTKGISEENAENSHTAPLHMIQELINKNHDKMAKEVSDLVAKQEATLRLEIQQLLMEYAGLAAENSPLLPRPSKAE